ncbi:TlpA family protein disulfide reductase [Tautonia sociabilis]|uniref:TlpA family protein disulfide reductase n=1 Tax=Tautonia sociabilis TaxID=2080755 RepID=A0A432MID4_9BACT|nr:TlpA disulfide reductase family protein [Tautonia sociabilis]RUL86965.1 TlpA family protein disulfide reductase [Tautonia sociabilis]
MLKRIMLAMAAAGLLAMPATAQEPGGDALSEAAEAVKKDPNSVETLSAYVNAAIQAILSDLRSDPAAAEEKIEGMRALIGAIEPTGDQAKQIKAQAMQVVPLLESRLEAAKITLEQAMAAVSAHPDDTDAISLLRTKLSTELAETAYSAPAEAAKTLATARDFLAEAKAKATPASAPAYDQTSQLLDQIAEAVESNLAREKLVGQDAAPLAVSAWVNGEPLSDSDLQGKVVLLDFWAVWCGPCIATFPHLIEWNERYGDKGLVIIGLTNYYEFQWDDEAGRAVPTPGTTPEQERAMLEKFAEHHGLTHRFAIQDGDAMSEFYQVSGIPQAVVIDQRGKVRMVRVGSGEANAKAIGDLIAELLGSPETAER